MLKIGIDYSLAFGERGGIGSYTFQLVDALSKIDSENQYLLYPIFYNFLMRKFDQIKYPLSTNFKLAFRNQSIPLPLLNQLFHFVFSSSKKEEMLGEVDVVHSTTFGAPRFKNKRLVVTIYDISVITHPECHQKLNIYHCTKGIKNAIKYADAIISISLKTKEDLVNYLGAKPELITVTPLASGPEYFPIKEAAVLEAVKIKYSLPSKFLLFVGSLEPRKNVKTLIKAFALLPERLKRECPLVIAGAKGWLNKEVWRIVDELKIGPYVKFIGYVSNEDISTVYSLATLFVYPSLYEGFGLPILEAMACGVPVITSNISSMPEVAGSAAILISPTDVEGLAEKIHYVVENESIRLSMREAGLKQASKFSWENCALQTLNVYRNVSSSPKGHTG